MRLFCLPLSWMQASDMARGVILGPHTDEISIWAVSWAAWSSALMDSLEFMCAARHVCCMPIQQQALQHT